jgi:hypothetical protein
MTELAATTRRADRHGIPTDLESKMGDRVIGGLPVDLGQRIVGESECGRMWRTRCYVEIGGMSTVAKIGRCKVNVWFISSRLGLCRIIQGIKTIRMLLLKVSECSFTQRGHSLAFIALLK